RASVIVPDCSCAFYAYRCYEGHGGEIGVAELVVVELKAPDEPPIGTAQKDQAWKYVRELCEKGLLDEVTRVRCWIVGKSIDSSEVDERTERRGKVVIRPMTYDTLIT